MPRFNIPSQSGVESTSGLSNLDVTPFDATVRAPNMPAFDADSIERGFAEVQEALVDNQQEQEQERKLWAQQKAQQFQDKVDSSVEQAKLMDSPKQAKDFLNKKQEELKGQWKEIADRGGADYAAPTIKSSLNNMARDTQFIYHQKQKELLKNSTDAVINRKIGDNPTWDNYEKVRGELRKNYEKNPFLSAKSEDYRDSLPNLISNLVEHQVGSMPMNRLQEEKAKLQNKDPQDLGINPSKKQDLVDKYNTKIKALENAGITDSVDFIKNYNKLNITPEESEARINEIERTGAVYTTDQAKRENRQRYTEKYKELVNNGWDKKTAEVRAQAQYDRVESNAKTFKSNLETDTNKKYWKRTFIDRSGEQLSEKEFNKMLKPEAIGKSDVGVHDFKPKYKERASTYLVRNIDKAGNVVDDFIGNKLSKKEAMKKLYGIPLRRQDMYNFASSINSVAENGQDERGFMYDHLVNVVTDSVNSQDDLSDEEKQIAIARKKATIRRISPALQTEYNNAPADQKYHVIQKASKKVAETAGYMKPSVFLKGLSNIGAATKLIKQRQKQREKEIKARKYVKERYPEPEPGSKGLVLTDEGMEPFTYAEKGTEKYEDQKKRFYDYATRKQLRW